MLLLCYACVFPCCHLEYHHISPLIIIIIITLLKRLVLHQLSLFLSFNSIVQINNWVIFISCSLAHCDSYHLPIRSQQLPRDKSPAKSVRDSIVTIDSPVSLSLSLYLTRNTRSPIVFTFTFCSLTRSPAHRTSTPHVKGQMINYSITLSTFPSPALKYSLIKRLKVHPSPLSGPDSVPFLLVIPLFVSPRRRLLILRVLLVICPTARSTTRVLCRLGLCRNPGRCCSCRSSCARP